MALEKNKKKGKDAADSSKPTIPMDTNKRLKLKAKRLRKKLRKKALKAKQVEESLQNLAANEEKNKAKATTGEIKESSSKGDIKESRTKIKESSTKGEIKESSSAGENKRSSLNPRENGKQEGSSRRNRKKKITNKKSTETSEAPNEEKKLGGLIFMCSSRTKPDCFRYKIMALPVGKKEIVLGIKPGLKLFLYDYDLRLLYGIYEASSPGGMKLEPTAFGGAFPAQVRFRTYEDCLPLHESVLKKAIKENYDERTHKFKTELTSKQVKKLKTLFRPAPKLHSKDCSYGQQPASYSTNPRYLTEKEYRSYGLRPEIHGLNQPAAPYVPIQDPYRSNQEEQILRSPALTFRDPTPSQEQILRNPATIYGNPPSTHDQIIMNRAPVFGDLPYVRDQAGGPEPHIFSEDEYRAYGLRGRTEQSPLLSTLTRPEHDLNRYCDDQYHSHNYHATSSDAYTRLSAVGATPYEPYSQLRPSDAYLPDMKPSDQSVDYHLMRRVSDEVPYSSYTSGELSEYNQTNRNLGSQYGHASAPVSSRYSFAGASYSLR